MRKIDSKRNENVVAAAEKWKTQTNEKKNKINIMKLKMSSSKNMMEMKSKNVSHSFLLSFRSHISACSNDNYKRCVDFFFFFGWFTHKTWKTALSKPSFLIPSRVFLFLLCIGLLVRSCVFVFGKWCRRICDICCMVSGQNHHPSSISVLKLSCEQIFRFCFHAPHRSDCAFWLPLLVSPVDNYTFIYATSVRWKFFAFYVVSFSFASFHFVA